MSGLLLETAYINVNVHEKPLEFRLDSNFMVYASRKVRFTSKRLHNFIINLEDDIIGFTTDGAL